LRDIGTLADRDDDGQGAAMAIGAQVQLAGATTA
jgi:hypothetical protein